MNNLNNFNSHTNIRSTYRASFDPTNDKPSNEYRHSIDTTNGKYLDKIQQEIQQQYEIAKAQQEQQWRDLQSNMYHTSHRQVIHHHNMTSTDEGKCQRYQILSPVTEYPQIKQSLNQINDDTKLQNNANPRNDQRERENSMSRLQRLTDLTPDLIINPCTALSSFRCKQTREPQRIPHELKGETYVLYPWLQPIKQLGEGAYARVIEVKDTRNDSVYAIKKNRNVFTNMMDARRMLREIKLMTHMDHENMFSKYSFLFLQFSNHNR